MNPSAKGWLNKLLTTVDTDFSDEDVLETIYPKLKLAGFIYGSNVCVALPQYENKDFTQLERCKINLILALHYVYKSTISDRTSFTAQLKLFYKNIGFYKTSFISDIFGEDVEQIIHKRIQIDNNIITKNFNYFATNALLFMDVLAFRVYLNQSNRTLAFLEGLENSIVTVVSEALNAKSKKNEYDESLIRLLKSSLRTSYKKGANLESLDAKNHTLQERLYLLDLACMATWSDYKIEKGEEQFFDRLREKFNFSSFQINDALSTVNDFYKNHKNDVALLSTKNMAKRFYDNSSSLVKKLISRNSKKLYQELKESKELVVLLSQSTVRDMTEEEIDKMQEQLLDVLKSIPSLAIFMLPGGAVLLPLFIKFIPKLLPSAFDDNRIEDQS